MNCDMISFIGKLKQSIYKNQISNSLLLLNEYITNHIISHKKMKHGNLSIEWLQDFTNILHVTINYNKTDYNEINCGINCVEINRDLYFGYNSKSNNFNLISDVQFVMSETRYYNRVFVPILNANMFRNMLNSKIIKVYYEDTEYMKLNQFMYPIIQTSIRYNTNVEYPYIKDKYLSSEIKIDSDINTI